MSRVSSSTFATVLALLTCATRAETPPATDPPRVEQGISYLAPDAPSAATSMPSPSAGSTFTSRPSPPTAGTRSNNRLVSRLDLLCA